MIMWPALYLVTLVCLFALSIAVVFLMRFMVKKTLFDIIFVVIVFVSYSLLVIAAYQKNGTDDWNFRNTLPYANISPFMFFFTPLFFVLPRGVQKYFGTLIALLCLGMILSSSISCIHYFSIGYAFHPEFVFDYIAHFALALFGIYLVQSKQVELRLKDSLIGGSIIVAVAVTMLIVNAIFDTSFFGLSLRGKHNIYNRVLVDNSFASAGIYFAGLFAALGSGLGLQKLLCLLRKRIDRNPEEASL